MASESMLTAVTQQHHMRFESIQCDAAIKKMSSSIIKLWEMSRIADCDVLQLISTFLIDSVGQYSPVNPNELVRIKIRIISAFFPAYNNVTDPNMRIFLRTSYCTKLLPGASNLMPSFIDYIVERLNYCLALPAIQLILEKGDCSTVALTEAIAEGEPIHTMGSFQKHLADLVKKNKISTSSAKQDLQRSTSPLGEIIAQGYNLAAAGLTSAVSLFTGPTDDNDTYEIDFNDAFFNTETGPFAENDIKDVIAEIFKYQDSTIRKAGEIRFINKYLGLIYYIIY